MFDRAKKLYDLPEITVTDKNELGMFYNAVIELMNACKKGFSAQLKKDLDAAREGLKECTDRLWPRYFPEDTPVPEGERFPNRKQALNWLQAQGYKVSQGKFYQDCEAGFPGVHKDGAVSRYQIMQYAQQIDVERRGAPVDTGTREHDENRKVRADADKAEMQAEEMRREMDIKWLHREEAWAQLAALVGTLRDAVRHQFHIGAAHIIHLAGGDSARGPEVYEGMEEILSRAYNEVLASGRIEGMFEQKEEEEAA